jgi:hypothetical protein
VVQTKYTISPIVESNKFHLATIKTALTPNLGLKIDEILDEIKLAFADEIGVSKGISSTNNIESLLTNIRMETDFYVSKGSSNCDTRSKPIVGWSSALPERGIPSDVHQIYY